MTRAELIVNSKFIRSSVESFADEYLIYSLVFSYARVVDELGVGVDYDFVKSIMSRNKVKGSSFFVFSSVIKTPKK